MDFNKWMKISGYTQHEISIKLKISTATVSQLMSRGRSPSIELAIEIVKLSKGQISYEKLPKI